MNPQSYSNEFQPESLLSEEGYKAARLAELMEAVPYLKNSLYVHVAPEIQEQIDSISRNYDTPPEYDAMAETSYIAVPDTAAPAPISAVTDVPADINLNVDTMDIDEIRRRVEEA
jgi:hypothetical protein